MYLISLISSSFPSALAQKICLLCKYLPVTETTSLHEGCNGWTTSGPSLPQEEAESEHEGDLLPESATQECRVKAWQQGAG